LLEKTENTDFKLKTNAEPDENASINFLTYIGGFLEDRISENLANIFTEFFFFKVLQIHRESNFE